jgi:hypothetical protein
VFLHGLRKIIIAGYQLFLHGHVRQYWPQIISVIVGHVFVEIGDVEEATVADLALVLELEVVLSLVDHLAQML